MSIVIYFFTFKLMIEKQLKITITNKMNKYNSTSSIWPTMHSLARDLIRLVPFYQSSSSIASTDITKMYSTNLYSFFHHAMREWKYAFLYSKVRRAITNVSTKCSVNPLHVFFVYHLVQSSMAVSLTEALSIAFSVNSFWFC